MGNLLDDPITITGLGLATGFGFEDSWRSILAGESSIRWLDMEYPHSDGISRETRPSLFAGATHRQRHRDESSIIAVPDIVQLRERVATTAAVEADIRSVDPERVGTVFGTSKGDLQSFDAAARVLKGQLSDQESRAFKRRDVDPDHWQSLYWDEYQPNASARAVHQIIQAAGPCLCPVAACATGLIAIIRGMQLIQDDVCDVVIAGAADSSVTRMLLPSYQRLGVLANRFTDPSTACRPMDRKRNGFLVGEGAAAFVLERASHAERRRVNHRYANLLAGGMVADASGLTRLRSDGEGLSYAINDVLRRGATRHSEIDYINLHGTGTRMNDSVEATAISRDFSGRADSLICSGQKGAIGHTMGAAGAVETAITLLAMRDQIAPPTRNLETPDAACHFELAHESAVKHPIQRAMKLSLGFGGHIAVALFARAD